MSDVRLGGDWRPNAVTGCTAAALLFRAPVGKAALSKLTSWQYQPILSYTSTPFQAGRAYHTPLPNPFSRSVRTRSLGSPASTGPRSPLLSPPPPPRTAADGAMSGPA